MTSAGLLPHERVCSSCGGDRRVPVVRFARSSVAEEPALATGEMATCEECDGTGVTIVESRSEDRAEHRRIVDALAACHRDHIIALLRDAERLDADRRERIDVLSIERDRYERVSRALARDVARLEDENRKLRQLVTKQSRLLDQSEPRRIA